MFKKQYITIFLTILSISTSSLFAQTKKDSAQSIFFVRFEYGYYNTAGDFENRFPNSNAAGGSIGFKTASNWQFGINAAAHFSNKVITNGLLNDIINEAGDATDADGELVKVTYEQRGLSLFFQVGKVFPVFGSNPNSGIITQAGIGFLRHNIKVDYRDGIVYQLSEDMLKGYDHLSSGIAIKQFVGYQYFGKRNLLNFYLGFELMQGYTKNKREYNYDTREFDTDLKHDFLYGFRAGWIIPIRKRASEEYYYY